MPSNKLTDKKTMQIERGLHLISIASPLFSLSIWQLYLPGRVSLIPFIVGCISSLVVLVATILKKFRPIEVSDCLAALLFPGLLLFIMHMDYLKIESYFQGLVRGEEFLFEVQLILNTLFWMQFINLIISITYKIHNSGEYLSKNKENIIQILITVTCLVILVIYIMRYQHVWYRWDSFNYYRGMSWIDSRNIFQSYSNGLVVAGHPAYAYALLVIFIDAIPGISLFQALYFTNGVVFLGTYGLIYKIYSLLRSFRYTWIYPLVALFTCFSTYILGSITQENPEHLGLLAIILLIWSLSSKRYCWTLLACWICCYTRETLVPVVTILLAIHFLQQFYKSHKDIEKKMGISEWVTITICVLIVTSWLLAYLGSNWSVSMNKNHALYYEDGTRLFSFSFSAQYIVHQLGCIFLTNFTWLFVLIGIIALTIKAKYNGIRRTLSEISGNETVLLLLTTVTLLTGIMCLYVTHHLFRYYTVIVVCIQLIVFNFCGDIWERFGSKYTAINQVISISILGTILLMSCYMTVDPIMLAYLNSIDTGAGRLAMIDMQIRGRSATAFFENANYNLQIPHFDEAIDLAYSEMNLEDSSILIYGGYSSYENANSSENDLWGYGYSYVDLYTSWDDQAKHRTLEGKSYNNVSPSFVNNIPQVKEYLEKDKETYYLSFSWGDELIDKLEADQSIKVIHLNTINHEGWKINIFKISLNR